MYLVSYKYYTFQFQLEKLLSNSNSSFFKHEYLNVVQYKRTEEFQ